MIALLRLAFALAYLWSLRGFDGAVVDSDGRLSPVRVRELAADRPYYPLGSRVVPVLAQSIARGHLYPEIGEVVADVVFRDRRAA